MIKNESSTESMYININGFDIEIPPLCWYDSYNKQIIKPA